ncbi:hypothetical protein ACWD69_17105 [Micromonospora chokoriensis]
MIAQEELADWILIALGELGGSASRHRVLSVMEGMLGGRLTADDHVRRRNGEPAWKNNASFARQELIEAGLLLSKTTAGHGTWALAPNGSRRSQTLRASQSALLCPSFRSIAANVTWSNTAGRSVGLVPLETTFTDTALLALATQHRGRIRIQRFNAHEEARSGADWEWWIRDRHGYVGFRVQAKRAHPRTGRVALDQRAATTASFDKQVEVFADRCRADNILGLYCIYSDWQPKKAGLAGPGPCPHGPHDTAQWGCTIVLADTALRLATSNRCDADTVLSNGMPWYHLVCHTRESMTIGIHRVSKRLTETEASIQRETYGAADRRQFPPPATQPPRQVAAFFQGAAQVLEPWSGLTGVVLIDNEAEETSDIGRS